MIHDLSGIILGVLIGVLGYQAYQDRQQRPENVVVIRSLSPCAPVNTLGRQLLRSFRAGKFGAWECHYEARKP